MKLTGVMLKSAIVRILVLAVILAANTASAQYTQGRPQTIPADPLMIVIPVRSLEEISNDIDNATADKQLALNRNVQAVNRFNEIELAIETRDLSIKDINRRKDHAGNINRKAEEASLKMEVKANKEAIDLLKRLRDLRRAEVEVAKAEEDYADMTIRCLQTEFELQGKRKEYNWMSTGNADELTQNTANQVILGLEVNLLNLQRDLTDAMQKVTSKQKDAVNRRMKLHEAQLKFGM